jgi:hypothetical protein
MAFEVFETGRFTGRPLRLFVFQRQALIWRYCTGDRNVVIGGNTYFAEAIDRSEIRQTAERAKEDVTITLPYLRDPAALAFPVTQALGDNWHPYIPHDTIAVTCLATHYGDTDPPAVEWSGIVTQPAFTDTELTLTCTPGPAIARARNQGPKFQRACWKTVYSTGLRGCNLVAGPIPVAGTLTAIAGNDITAAEFVPQARTFVGGTASWDDAGTPRIANITAHVGTTLTLDDVTGLVIGSQATAYTVPLWTEATLSAVSGLDVTAAAFAIAPLPLDGGWLEWTRGDGLVERRSIMAHSGDTVTLLYGAAALAAGLAVTARPGCPRTWAACEARGNTINYGGSVYKPGKDPMLAPMSWG